LKIFVSGAAGFIGGAIARHAAATHEAYGGVRRRQELGPGIKPVITGDLAFHYHHEGHTITLTDWNAFFAFADRYLKPVPPAAPPGL